MIKNYRNMLFLLTLPLALGIKYFAYLSPMVVEHIYSQGFYRIIRLISVTTGLVPFSIGELALYSLFIWIIYKIIIISKLIYFTPKNFLKVLKSCILNSIKYLSILYLIFLLIWGLNYYRLPFSTLVNLETTPSTIKELENLCNELIHKANEVREHLKENDEGVVFVEGGYNSVFDRAGNGYQVVSKYLPVLKGTVGKPKPVILSRLMSYTGITGIYFPFTGEANINIKIPSITLPSTTCHEIAHQYGFAREDEANYIAYLTCVNHPDKDFQYSGTLLALIHSMKALYRHDKEKYLALREGYSDGLERDLNAINSYWKKYEGPIERASNKVNDIYLKSNKQDDGIYSYGKMVDLLLSEFKSKKSINYFQGNEVEDKIKSP